MAQGRIMAAIISPQDVNEFHSTGKSDFVIQTVIDTVDAADACLDGANIPAPQQTLLKIYATLHQLTLMSGGQVKSASSMTGDSISYHAATGSGFDATNWGLMMKSMPGASCIEDILNKSDIQVFSVGRRA